MFKKLFKKSSRYQSTVTAVILAIVLTAFISSSVIYLQQKASLKTAEAKYKSELTVLQNQIAHLQGDTAEEGSADEGTVVSVTVPSTAPDTSTAPDVEFAFENCGFLGSFIYEDWYPKLRDELYKIGINTGDVSSACYSKKGGIVVMIAQKGTECEGPMAYKFNTSMNTSGAAKVLNKGVSCLSPLDTFGKRDGVVINTTGQRKSGNCSYKDYFKYNYGKNVVELTKTGSKCAGDAEWKITEY